MSLSTEEARAVVLSLANVIQSLNEQASGASRQQLFDGLCASAGGGRVEITRDGGGLRAQGDPVDASTPAVQTLQAALERHAIAALVIDWSTTPEELTVLSRLLSDRAPTTVEPIDTRAHALGCWSIVFRLHATSAPDIAAQLTVAHPLGAGTAACASVDAAQRLAAEIVAEARALLLAGDAVQVTRLLRDVARAEETSGTGTSPVRPVWERAFNEIATRECVELVASLLPRSGMPASDLLAVLKRVGDSAGNVLLGKLFAASRLAERRMLYDTIVHVHAAVGDLTRCLKHAQWHVVRNAALLLGAMQERDAEGPLSALLKHADPRVRLAAVAALAQVGTPTALASVEMGMADADTTVRRHCFRHLRHRPDFNIGVAAISDAIDLEADSDAQRDLFLTLMNHGSPNAVSKLVRFASPSRFQKFAVPVRIIILEGIARLRPGSVVPLLRAATADQDPLVSKRANELLAA